MSKAYSDHRVYVFGDFTLDVDRASLFRADTEISLRPKSFDVLRYLVDRQGKLVSRDELHDAIWGTTVVTDDAVTQCLIDIRKALDDISQSIIRTVPRRGYVFELPVTRPADPAEASRPVTEPAPARWTAFKKAAASLGAITVLALAIVWLMTSEQASAPEPDARVEGASAPSIAVLPFTVLSDDPSQTYFADGVAEEVLSLLAQQRGLKVIARTSSFSFRDRNVDIAVIADRLGVSHVLEGSFRNDGDQIRINVELVDGATGEFLWTEHFDSTVSASNIFAIQREIATAVSESLMTELSVPDHHRVRRIPTDSLEALDAYFEGRAKMETRHIRQLDEASQLFEKAITLDPDFALAHVALADVSLLRTIYGSLTISAALQRIEDSVDTALAIDDQIGEAYLPLANLLWWRYGDAAGTEQAFLRGIELSPNYAPLYQWYSQFLAEGLARPLDAIRYAKMAVALDPRSAITIVDYAERLREANQLDEALAQLDRAIIIDPGLGVAYLRKAWLLRHHKGEIAYAIPLIEQAYRIMPQAKVVLMDLSASLLDLGDFERAEALIDEAMSLAPGHGWVLLSHAFVQIVRGDRAGAVESARAALEDDTAHPGALAILRDHYVQERQYEQALELYRQYHPSLFDESSRVVDLVGWNYPVAIDLSVLLLDIGRTDLAAKLLGAALNETERRRRLGIGPPSPELARIHALLGNTDAALQALRLAVDNGWRSDWRLTLYHDAALDSLRELPEFQAIVATVEADIARQRRELEARDEALRPVSGLR